jgi:penicillin-binding protein 2
MFHRRLILLLAVMVLGFTALAAKTAQLTLKQGDELRLRAESKLVMREFFPTMRGRILDRKGRILAQDRPSFDVTVDYRVISGQWAITQAAAAARRLHGAADWRRLSPQERQALIDDYVPIFQRHLDQMWSLLAETAGVDEARVHARREEIMRRVDAMAESVVVRRVREGLDARLAAGREISAETEEEIRRRVERPLREQRAPHIILPHVEQNVGFALLRLADRKVELEVYADDSRHITVLVNLMPEMRIPTTGAREYPYESMRVEVDLSTLPGPMKRDERLGVIVEGVAIHILGRMKGAAQLEDTQRRRARLAADESFRERVLSPADLMSRVDGLAFAFPRIDLGEYHENDPAGVAGVELAREEELRGLRGITLENLETGKPVEHKPVIGGDVHLTIDVALQARIQALMTQEVGLAVAQRWHGNENPTVPIGTPLNGAAVVLDVDSGDILAMVSSPSLPRRIYSDDGGAFFSDPMNEIVNQPWFDRSVNRPYPPGSIVKAIMVPAAVKLGRLDLDQTIDCTGHLLPNQPNMYRCWIYKGHWNTTHNVVFGRGLTAPEALMVSCNIYFYTLGQRLTPDGIVEAYTMFGLGKPIGLGIGAEFAGYLGPQGNQSRMRIGDAILMGIGQGPVAWTPLHAADAYATLARGGIRLPPRVVDDGPVEPIDLGLNSRAISESLTGLHMAVNQPRGTGHHIDISTDGETARYKHFTAPNVIVWGKTGTAEAPTIRVKQGEPLYDMGVDDLTLPEGERLLRKGDHSWFVVMVGSAEQGRPQYVIAVLMEYAGSGGKVSGPIVNQIIYTLQAEGYL